MPLRVVLRWSEQGQAGHTAWCLVVEHSRFILAVITVCCPWFTCFPDICSLPTLRFFRNTFLAPARTQGHGQSLGNPEDAQPWPQPQRSSRRPMEGQMVTEWREGRCLPQALKGACGPWEIPGSLPRGEGPWVEPSS